MKYNFYSLQENFNIIFLSFFHFLIDGPIYSISQQDLYFLKLETSTVPSSYHCSPNLHLHPSQHPGIITTDSINLFSYHTTLKSRLYMSTMLIFLYIHILISLFKYFISQLCPEWSPIYWLVLQTLVSYWQYNPNTQISPNMSFAFELGCLSQCCTGNQFQLDPFCVLFSLAGTHQPSSLHN